MSRTILIHLNVEAHENDSRSAEEIAADVMGGIEVASEESPLSNLEIALALTEEL